MIVYYITTTFAAALAWLGNAPQIDRLQERTPWHIDSQRGRIAALAVAAGLIPVVVAALRWRVGTDYWNYETLYTTYTSSSLTGRGLLGEPGLPALAAFSAQLYDDPSAMFAMAAAITVGLFVNTLWRLSPLFSLSIALYILLGTWQGSFNGIRQYLAAAIVFAAHPYILRRRFGWYLFAVILASLFHLSALACLALYAVPVRRLQLGGMLALGAASATVALGQSKVLVLLESLRHSSSGTEILDWTSSEAHYFTESVHPLRVALAFVPLILFSVVATRSVLTSEDYFYMNMLFVNAAVWIAAAGSAYLARFAIYSSMFLAIGIPRLVCRAPRDARVPLTACLLTLYAVFWHIDTSNVPELAHFRWIWDRP